MCLYPKLIINKKYTITKKNKGSIPVIKDNRAKYVAVGCGKCIECTKAKAKAWEIRMLEELKNDNKAKFITLSFSNESIDKLEKEYGLKEANEVATKGMRLMLERWRKDKGKSVKHWCVTELGKKNTERIHIHGIFWTKEEEEYIKKIWKYGNVYIGDYVNNITISYIVKYMSKLDIKHKGFIGKVLCSSGIGNKYIEKGIEINKYDEKNTKMYYKMPNGSKSGLPMYYRNKIYSDEEREKLWMNKIDENTRYVLGEKITADNNEELEEKWYKLAVTARIKNKRLGYGDDSKVWKRKSYQSYIKNIKK